MKTKEVLLALDGVFLSGSGPYDPPVYANNVSNGPMGSAVGELVVGEERFHIQISEF